MQRRFAAGTVLVAAVAAVGTGLLSDKIIEDFENDFNAGGMWNQVAFILLVPAALGTITLALPGRRDEWMPFVLVAALAAFAMAYAVGLEVVNGLDQNLADKYAARVWYGVMYFGGGMLVPLSVALGRTRDALRNPPP